MNPKQKGIEYRNIDKLTGCMTAMTNVRENSAKPDQREIVHHEHGDIIRIQDEIPDLVEDEYQNSTLPKEVHRGVKRVLKPEEF